MEKDTRIALRDYSTPILDARVIKFIDFMAKRFGVYLDTISGFKKNLKSFNDTQNQMSEVLSKPIEQLDQFFFMYGDGKPPTDVEAIGEEALHIRTQAQFKKDNSDTGINSVFAIYNCCSDISNQWKYIVGIGNHCISALVYILKIRNRTQHEIYDDFGRIPANSPIEIPKTLGGYVFPRFYAGEYIVLTEKDCKELIREIELQLLHHPEGWPCKIKSHRT